MTYDSDDLRTYLAHFRAKGLVPVPTLVGDKFGWTFELESSCREVSGKFWKCRGVRVPWFERTIGGTHGSINAEAAKDVPNTEISDVIHTADPWSGVVHEGVDDLEGIPF